MSQLAFKTLDDTFDPAPDFIACSRCGIDINFATVAKRISRGNHETRCRDCIATQAVRVPSPTGIGNCYPWTGDVDLDTMQPINSDGSLYLPGRRVCKRSDCVNQMHIVDFHALEAERHDLSYRTGKRLPYTGLMAALKKEAGQ